MNYDLIKEVVDLVRNFEKENAEKQSYTDNIDGFKQWMMNSFQEEIPKQEPYWEGKEKGRSAESAINTLIVHMNRYAKNYSKSAIYNSDFSTQEDFIYLINLKAFGAMTKMELIKKNIQDKPVGMQIINRLIDNGWVNQTDSKTDKRSKVIEINKKGLTALERQMDNIRQATKMVTGDLDHEEKMELIRILNKLDDFHHPIYCENLDPSALLEVLKKTNFN